MFTGHLAGTVGHCVCGPRSDLQGECAQLPLVLQSIGAYVHTHIRAGTGAGRVMTRGKEVSDHAVATDPKKDSGGSIEMLNCMRGMKNRMIWLPG